MSLKDELEQRERKMGGRNMNEDDKRWELRNIKYSFVRLIVTHLCQIFALVT